MSSEWVKRRAAAQLRKGELLAAIRALEMGTCGEMVAAIVKHHTPDEDRRYCDGCDMGCSCEAASWPCSTVVLVLTHYGVDTTDIDLIDWKGEL